MTSRPVNLDLVRGEVRSKIHWGGEVEDALELLQTKYGIVGEQADAIVAEAVSARAKAVRQKAVLWLVFAAAGLAASLSYFAIQWYAGFVEIGFGPLLMAALGLGSLFVLIRSLVRLITGSAPGPAN